ncbi:PAS domain S-box protein [Halobacteria archaeon AArc-curdl1]|uniref:PAS domain S-box protein n=1 Tax=Natronosalvus hydrolyticus TaxID=2979988 RepID=A0AAP3E7B2_9EURY|nr:PAS domain S-box protein [Halobacteria archaeon AArc-curdl1]
MDRLSLLYIGDDERFLASLLGARSDDVFSVITEPVASDVLERLADPATTVDGVLCEGLLSGTEWLDVLTTVREESDDVPFFLCLETVKPDIVHEAFEAGVTDCLDKSQSKSLLSRRLERLVEPHRSHREQQNVYRALETATEGIGLIDESNHYLYLNESYADLYGYDREELLGEHWEKLYPDDEVRRFEDRILPRLEAEGIWSGESYGQRVTGELFPERVSLTQLEDGGHVCVVRDITDRVERQRQFETLLKNIRGMVYRAENAPDWPMTQVQGNVEEFLGYTADELESGNVSWGNRIHPDDEQRLWDVVQTELERSGTFEVTYRVYDADGNVKWLLERGRGVFDQDGEVEALEGLITDITVRKAREEELEWKTKAIDEAPVGVVIADPNQPDLPITYVNDHFTALTGYERTEALGENCRFLQGPLTSEETLEQIRYAIEHEEPVNVDILNYRKDSTPFWNNLHITPIRDESGELTHFIGFQNNVTTRVAHERRIAVLHRVIQHNIRNNMNILLGTLDSLESGHAFDSDTLESVRAPAVRLLELSEQANRIESLLASASFEPQTLSLESILDGELDAVRGTNRAVDIELSVETTCDIIAPETIAVAFGELFENAVKHSSDAPATLAVTAETETIGFPPNGEKEDVVTIHVDDSNAVLSDLDVTRLLGQDESPIHHGSGLGLWLVNWLVTMSGGVLSHRPRDGGGNRISITMLRDFS